MVYPGVTTPVVGLRAFNDVCLSYGTIIISLVMIVVDSPQSILGLGVTVLACSFIFQ